VIILKAKLGEFAFQVVVMRVELDVPTAFEDVCQFKHAGAGVKLWRVGHGKIPYLFDRASLIARPD